MKMLGQYASLAVTIIVLSALSGCGQIFEQSRTVRFSSDWTSQPDRIWPGPACWAGPQQDWRVANGRLECLVQGKDRKVNLLTYQITPKSTLKMQATIGRLTDAFVDKGWVGFQFANHGLMDDYRHNCIYGKGISAGLRTDGHLFIGGAKFSTPIAMDREITLTLHLTPGKVYHHALLIAQDSATGEILAKFGDRQLSNAIHGNVALVAHVSAASVVRTPSYYFKRWTVSGSHLTGGPEQNFGPILWAQYTLSRGVVKMSVQFPPIGVDDAQEARLQIRDGSTWREIARAPIDADARTAGFRIADWSDTKDMSYRVAYRWQGRDVYHAGTIRRDPVDQQTISVAGFTGNQDYGFPNLEIIANVAALNPDLLFFSGDQIYEKVAGYKFIREPVDLAMLDYLRKWYLLGWAFKDILRDRPSVILPDDHDVYQGNIWGQGGRAAELIDEGGYIMPALWVKMVERTQTAHLPDPFDPTPIEQGIGVYYTDMLVGRVSFAILEDRKFKHGPRIYTQGGRDQAEAQLLGERQLDFLRRWAADWRGCDLKATFSQTIFAQCHTHGGTKGLAIPLDHDANGWPPAGRNRALREIRKGFAFMYAGDNHLPTVVHHGIDDFEDAGISFSVPSIAAGFPRAWWPEKVDHVTKQGALPASSLVQILKQTDRVPDYLGRYVSPWGHPITFLAAANPARYLGQPMTPRGDIQALTDKSSGFGFVRFNTHTHKITVECYPALTDLTRPETAQFSDWPVVIDQLDNYGRRPVAYLPTLNIIGTTDPVVQVVNERNSEIVYTLRIKGNQFRPKVFDSGIYTIKIGEPDGEPKILTGVNAIPPGQSQSLTVSF